MSTKDKKTNIPLQQTNTPLTARGITSSKGNPPQTANNILNLSATPFIPIGLRDKKNTTENDNTSYQKFQTGMCIGSYPHLYNNHMLYSERGSNGKGNLSEGYKGSNVQGKTMLNVDAKPFFSTKMNDKTKIVLKTEAPVFKPKFLMEKEKEMNDVVKESDVTLNKDKENNIQK